MTQVERFSTDTCPTGARVAFWNRLANETFVDLAIDPANRDGFRGELVRAEVGPIALAVAHSTPAEVHRTPGGAAWAAPEPVFFLHLQGRGRSICEQDGRQAFLGPGDFCISDASRPYVLKFAEAHEMFVAKIPGRMVRERIPGIEMKTARRMGGEDIRASLLSSFVRGACDHLGGAQDDVWCDAVSNTVLELLELAYGDHTEGSSVRARLRRRASRLIEDELCDPNLTPNRIAASLGVTPRYLQMAFADIGSTPSDYIREKRLDLARRLLTADARPRTITELALEVGFGDLTYFSRAFRNRFGSTPRDYRARHLGLD